MAALPPGWRYLLERDLNPSGEGLTGLVRWYAPSPAGSPVAVGVLVTDSHARVASTFEEIAGLKATQGFQWGPSPALEAEKARLGRRLREGRPGGESVIALRDGPVVAFVAWTDRPVGSSEDQALAVAQTVAARIQ